MIRTLGCFFLVALGTSFVTTPLVWGKPSIASAAPRGLTLGRSTTVVIEGADLAQSPQLLCPVAGFRFQLRSPPANNRLEATIDLPADAAPGIYPLRVATATGVSSALLIAVDGLPQQLLATPAADPVALPVALSGALSGGSVAQAAFAAKKGERITVDLEAQRLGAAWKPVLRVLDARGTQVAFSGPVRRLGGDPRLVFEPAADGVYTAEFHDQLYRAAAPGHFRLKLGALATADLVLPLGVQVGQSAEFRAVGAALPPFTWSAPATAIPGAAGLPVSPSWSGFTGLAPRIELSSGSELSEPQGAASPLPLLPAAPTAVSGLLAQPNEQDRYELTVRPQQKLRLELFAQRLGSPLDGALAVAAASGAGLANSDDRPGTADPAVEVTVPAGVEKLVVTIRDSLGRGGGEFVYRLAVTDSQSADFALSVADDRLEIPAGGAVVVPVTVTRTHYDGPIALSFTGLPPGVQVGGGAIAPGATIALVTLAAPPGAAPAASLVQIQGLASAAQPPVARAAEYAPAIGGGLQPQLRRSLGAAVVGAAPVQLTWSIAPGAGLVLGGKTPLALKLVRGSQAQGKVRLRLLTTQPTPKKTIKENNQDKVVDAVERTLRLEGDVVLAENASEGVAQLLTPADLPAQPYDLVLTAELLGGDGKTVVSASAAPVQTVVPQRPFALEASVSGPVIARAGAGETGTVRGKVVRAPGVQQAVVVTVEGLPAGYLAPQAVVAPTASEFELPLRFPFGTKPGQLPGAKLVAVAAPLAASSARSNAFDLSLKVEAGEKPAAEEPRALFEDDEAFLAQLTEGQGRVVPEPRERYSGKLSLRVVNDHKSNPKLAGMELKIRERPGPGEFRFLRYAWRKQGGNAICLQLAHEGAFGPGGGRAGAVFRYHAGPGGECYGGSVPVSEQLPVKFEVVTRDLFADFGEFTLTGLGFAAVDGQAALFDHLYLARSLDDFSLAPPAGP